jgi:hypothetical protein
MNTFRIANHDHWPAHLTELRFIGSAAGSHGDDEIAIVSGERVIAFLRPLDGYGWELDIYNGDDFVDTVELVLPAGSPSGMTESVAAWASMMVLDTLADNGSQTSESGWYGGPARECDPNLLSQWPAVSACQDAPLTHWPR